jgi:hypothetical protein
VTKLIIPFTDDPMGHPPGTGSTPEQIEAARKSILEAEDERILAEMRRIAEASSRQLPADDPRKPEDLEGARKL